VRGALGYIRNRKTEEKIIQNRKTAKKFSQNRKTENKVRYNGDKCGVYVKPLHRAECLDIMGGERAFNRLE